MSKGRKVLPTGDVAEACNVSGRTAVKWFDEGLLEGYKLPGSKDRRIPRGELVRFMKEYGIPGGERLIIDY